MGFTALLSFLRTFLKRCLVSYKLQGNKGELPRREFEKADVPDPSPSVKQNGRLWVAYFEAFTSSVPLVNATSSRVIVTERLLGGLAAFVAIASSFLSKGSKPSYLTLFANLKVKSAFEPSGPSGRSFSRFL